MQGVLCPMEYKISLGMKVQTNFRVHKNAMWSPVSVTRILTNEIYTGVLIQGKSGTPNYKVKKVMPKDAHMPRSRLVKMDAASDML